MFLCAVGQLYTWGQNQFGQLGIGPDADKKKADQPVLIQSLQVSKGLSGVYWHSNYVTFLFAENVLTPS